MVLDSVAEPPQARAQIIEERRPWRRDLRRWRGYGRELLGLRRRLGRRGGRTERLLNGVAQSLNQLALPKLFFLDVLHDLLGLNNHELDVSEEFSKPVRVLVKRHRQRGESGGLAIGQALQSGERQPLEQFLVGLQFALEEVSAAESSTGGPDAGRNSRKSASAT